jgi:hypothetical protein
MKTRDLFACCSVTIAPHDDVWLVSLVDDALHTVAMQTYHELSGALEAVHEWSLMLSDDEEIGLHAAHALDLLRAALARVALGEEAQLPKTIEDARERDEQRAWFEREMGTNRQ